MVPEMDPKMDPRGDPKWIPEWAQTGPKMSAHLDSKIVTKLYPNRCTIEPNTYPVMHHKLPTGIARINQEWITNESHNVTRITFRGTDVEQKQVPNCPLNDSQSCVETYTDQVLHAPVIRHVSSVRRTIPCCSSEGRPFRRIRMVGVCEDVWPAVVPRQRVQGHRMVCQPLVDLARQGHTSVGLVASVACCTTRHWECRLCAAGRKLHATRPQPRFPTFFDMIHAPRDTGGALA